MAELEHLWICASLGGCSFGCRQGYWGAGGARAEEKVALGGGSWEVLRFQMLREWRHWQVGRSVMGATVQGDQLCIPVGLSHGNAVAGQIVPVGPPPRVSLGYWHRPPNLIPTPSLRIP